MQGCRLRIAKQQIVGMQFWRLVISELKLHPRFAGERGIYYTGQENEVAASFLSRLFSGNAVHLHARQSSVRFSLWRSVYLWRLPDSIEPRCGKYLRWSSGNRRGAARDHRSRHVAFAG